MFPDLIPKIAHKAGLDTRDHVIDLYSFMGGKDLSEWQFFCDDQNCDPCHPNDSGYSFLAAQVFNKLFG